MATVYINIYFTIYSGLLLVLMSTLEFQCLAMEPKSLRELRAKIEKTAFTYDEPRQFIITRDNSLYLDKKLKFSRYHIQQKFIPFGYHQGGDPPCNHYNTNIGSKEEPNIIWIYIVPLKSFTKCLIQGYERVVWTSHDIRDRISAATYPPPFLDGPFRPFHDSCWDMKSIGAFSYDYRLGNMEKHITYSTTFYRGNVKAYVFYIYIAKKTDVNANQGNRSDFEIMFQIHEQPLDPDPREIAWRIDQYLKGDPLEKFSEEEKQKLKTLEITLPDEVEFEQGKEYPLDFPRKSSDGTVPAEIRLVVSRGEIQQVLDVSADEDQPQYPNPASRAPDIDGDYTVLFGQPEKQTVHCYHINEEGKCLAWGEIEVFVKKSINPKSE